MVASCILAQLQQTASHAERSIENCHRMHTNIQHLHNETFIRPIHEHLQLHASQYKQKYNIHHTPYRNIQHNSTLQGSKKHIFNGHLAIRGNNKILRTPPSHISSSEEKLPASLIAPLPNSEQINHPSSNHIYTSRRQITSITDYAASVTLTHDTHISSTASHIHTTLSPLDLWTDPAGVASMMARWKEKLAGGPQAGTSDSPH